MVFSSVKTGAEMKFSRTSSWSMVSILNFLHRYSFQFIKNDSAAMLIGCTMYKNGGYSLCKLK